MIQNLSAPASQRILFVSASRFVTPLENYVFKNGNWGLGYYRDMPQNADVDAHAVAGGMVNNLQVVPDGITRWKLDLSLYEDTDD